LEWECEGECEGDGDCVGSGRPGALLQIGEMNLRADELWSLRVSFESFELNYLFTKSLLLSIPLLDSDFVSASYSSLFLCRHLETVDGASSFGIYSSYPFISVSRFVECDAIYFGHPNSFSHSCSHAVGASASNTFTVPISFRSHSRNDPHLMGWSIVSADPSRGG
jgi:hypothetical protein